MCVQEPFIKVDFNRWKDEDESDSEDDGGRGGGDLQSVSPFNVVFNFHLYSCFFLQLMQNMDMGAMGAMGGPGGDSKFDPGVRVQTITDILCSYNPSLLHTQELSDDSDDEEMPDLEP